MSYVTTLLTGSHEKATFSCGNILLDNYIQKQARQDMKAKLAACFILADDEKKIKGYYTLSNGAIPRSQIPDTFTKHLPKYQDMPVTLLGRLAVAVKLQGQKLGELLLLDALKRSYDNAATIGSMTIIVDPIDQQAANFYERYGFILLADSGRMFLPMKTIGQLFK